jgi:hypothetical protein
MLTWEIRSTKHEIRNLSLTPHFNAGDPSRD